MKKLLYYLSLLPLLSVKPGVNYYSTQKYDNQLSNLDTELIKNFGIDKKFFEPKNLPGLKNKNISALAVDNDGIIYAGLDVKKSGGGLYKSTDGFKFEKISDLQNFSIRVIVIHENSIYVGTEQNGLYKSTDGANFEKICAINIECLVFQSNNYFYIGTSEGLYKSTDGFKFEKISDLQNFYIPSLAIYNDTIYVGTFQNGLYKSTDGANFEKINDVAYIISTAISNTGEIYIGTSFYLYKSIDGGKTFSEIDNLNTEIHQILITREGHIFVGTSFYLYKSIDGGKTFSEFYKGPVKISLNSLFVTPEGIVGVGTEEQGIWVFDFYKKLWKINDPDYIGDVYDGFVYKNKTVISLKNKYIADANLDGNTVTIPSQNVPLTKGKHTLILTIKDEYKHESELFGGNEFTGQVTINFWIKTTIDPINELNYDIVTSDVELLNGLVSTSGNTKDKSIVQTRSKKGGGIHPAKLTIKLSKTLDLSQSYYVLGNVKSNNDFFETAPKIHNLSDNFVINNDGIYHMHLVDFIGNTNDCYLELGESNWQLQGTFDDIGLNNLAAQLNVRVILNDPSKKQEAMGWLQKYQTDANNAFNNSLNLYGKGFDLSINNFKNMYLDFLDSVTYSGLDCKEAINEKKLNQLIKQIAEEKLASGLFELPKDLNVDTINVTDKLTLENYSSWITGYQNYINENKNNWINNISNIASRGFATENQIKQIKDFVNGLNFSDYLKKVIWTPNINLGANNDYDQFIELDKLKLDTINWVNNNIPELMMQYEAAIKAAESQLNLHGYSINELLNNNKLPETKTEIDNYLNSGQNFHDWLQKQADSKYHTYQLKLGLGLGLPLTLLSIGIGLFLYWKFSKKYNPYHVKTKITNKEKSKE